MVVQNVSFFLSFFFSYFYNILNVFVCVRPLDINRRNSFCWFYFVFRFFSHLFFALLLESNDLESFVCFLLFLIFLLCYSNGSHLLLFVQHFNIFWYFQQKVLFFVSNMRNIKLNSNGNEVKERNGKQSA